jgi:hypothetical protein
MHRGNPHDRNPGCARPPNFEQALCFLQPIGLDVGSQQGELDQVVLCAATANAFVLVRQWRQRFDRAGKSPRSNDAKPPASAGR